MVRKKSKDEEVEVFEIFLDDKKIGELEEKIKELKENKEHVHFEDLKKNQVLIVHRDSKII